jgi:hypothetical protein
VSSDEKGKEIKGSLGGSPKKYFLPKDLVNATAEEIWFWWQRKGQQESVLKSAIASEQVMFIYFPSSVNIITELSLSLFIDLS